MATYPCTRAHPDGWRLGSRRQLSAWRISAHMLSCLLYCGLMLSTRGPCVPRPPVLWNRGPWRHAPSLKASLSVQHVRGVSPTVPPNSTSRGAGLWHVPANTCPHCPLPGTHTGSSEGSPWAPTGRSRPEAVGLGNAASVRTTHNSKVSSNSG